jgi:predicted outer membrane protein
MSLSRRCLLSLACLSALAMNARAADPAAPEKSAAGERRAAQNRTERDATNPNRNAAARERTETENQPAQEGSLDAQLAACLIIGNHKEIAVSRLADQHSQNAEVKKFAEMMIADHEKFVSELQKFAEQGGFQSQQLAVDSTDRAPATRRQPVDNATPSRTTAERSPNARGDEATRRTARSEALDQRGQRTELISIEREVAEQCLQSAQKEMSEKQGAELDQCYIGMQIGAHMGMVDKLEVFSRHASPELQAILQQGQQTAQKHLDHAKQLHKQLEGQASAQQPAAEKKS